jgi:hypothetical protein
MFRFRLVVIALLLAAPVQAKLLPSFELDWCAWHATHIVVVDAKGTVLESWQGDLKAGQKLSLDQLGVPPSEPIVYPFRPRQATEPERVTGARIVLFLIRDGDKWKPAASYGGMKLSTVWIERDQAHAFMQAKSRDSCELIPMACTEAQLKQKIADIETLHGRLRATAQHVDPTKRAEETLRFVESEFWYCRYEAFDILAAQGKGVLPVLRKVLQDDKRLRLHADILSAMGKAGGVDARDDLLNIVAMELRYWKKIGPTLGEWWGQEPMTTHYGRLSAALRQLRVIGVTEEQRKQIEELRDYWSSVPSLDAIGKGTGSAGQVGRSQIAEEADGVLKPR